MRKAITASCLLLLSACTPGAFAAQQPSRNGVDQFNASNPFAGLDPLAGKGEIFPARGNPPNCVPPVSTWQLVGQNGTECYYFAPFPQRLNGYVTSINNVGTVEKAGGRCGVDEFNASEVVCQNPGDDFRGASSSTGVPTDTSKNDPTASTGRYRRQPVRTLADPCHPNYNMSTAAGRAAAVKNAPQDQEACEEERCKHNPELIFCKKATPETARLAAAASPCESLAGIIWSSEELATIQKAINDAKKGLSAAKPHIDRWDGPTQKIAMTWFGDASEATHNIMKARMNNVIELINKITVNNFYPASDPTLNLMETAYVFPEKSSAAGGPQSHHDIFLGATFWLSPANGTDGRDMDLVHELSHFKDGGGTEDLMYVDDWCKNIVYIKDQIRKNPAIANLIPGTKEIANMDMRYNADSFEFFVYDVSQEK